MFCALKATRSSSPCHKSQQRKLPSSKHKNNNNDSQAIRSVGDIYVRDLSKFLEKRITLPLLFFLLIYCIDPIQCANQVSPSTVTGLGKSISQSHSATSASRSDGKDGRGNNADDSESSLNHPHHHHHHNQHRHQHHHHRQSSSSGKNSPHPSSSSSTSSTSSLYPSTSAYGYPDYYNTDSFYEPRYYERPSREFSARSTSYPAIMASASSSQVGFADTEYGGLAMATGHGGGHGGHHHGGGHEHGGGYGHGHGHGHHTTYYKTVNKLDQSSLGLLGLLGLLSLLSNVLMLLTTTPRASTMAMMGMGDGGGGGMVNLRIKRDAMMLVKLRDTEERKESQERRSVVERLSRLILPSLNIVGHAKDGRIPINCTYQEVCKTNRVLIEIFGADGGRPVGSVLSTAIAKLLSDNNNKRDRHHQQHHHLLRGIKVKSHHHPIAGTSEAAFVLVEKLLQQAGLAGRNGVDCEVVYPTCEALTKNGSDGKDNSVNDIEKNNGNRSQNGIQLPFLISPQRALAIILGES